ncbi:MAG: T9SS type A sorting domain-containing protein [Cryomorphaceae bacterium]|nr:T9SS type A sorting domain-containing protein [Cryomorphaceae bacterium]
MRIFPFFVFAILLSFSVKAQTIIHYWHFNNLSGTVDSVSADYSFHANAPFISYPGTGDGYMDDVSDGATINLRQGQIDGSGLRVRNPSDTRHLLLELPTTDFEDVQFSFAVKRTSNGAQRQWLSFSTDGGTTWQDGTPFGDSVVVTEDYELESFNFSGVSSANDNPDFMVKINFFEGSSGLSGNNRFDNIVLEGNPLVVIPVDTMDLIHYWHFNNLGVGEVTDPVPADYTRVPNVIPTLDYLGVGDGYMDDFSPGSGLNLHRGAAPGVALRVRNPSFDRALVIELPTTECEGIKLMYDVHRSGSGMLFNNVAYSLDGVNYDTVGMDIKQVSVTETYQTFSFDFSAITAANDNPNFKVRITWSGNTNQPNGNNRFDNIAMLAGSTTLSAHNFASEKADQIKIYPNPSNDVINAEWVEVHSFTYQLMDMQGKQILQGSGSELQRIDVSGIPSGAYVLRLIHEGNMQIRKVVISK